MKDSVFQHFAAWERPFIEEAEDWRQQVLGRYEQVLTDFLNPRQRWIIRRLYGKSEDFHYAFFGGFEEAENQRLLLSPFYQPIAQADFKVQAYQVHYPVKFSSLTHSQIMGTILGEGIARTRLGDIATDGTSWQFVMAAELGPYIQGQVHRVGRTSVALEAIGLDQLLTPVDDWQRRRAVVSSLRLDTLLAEAFGLSRAKAKAAVEAGRVKVNWQLCQNPAREVHDQDIVSLAHQGRLRLDARGEPTRKGNFPVQLSLLKSKGK